MSIRTLALTASVLLAASPALAAKHKPDPVLDHSGPVSYSDLQQLGSQGYNSRTATRRVQAPVDAAPVAADATAIPSVANPADSVNPPRSDLAPPVNTTTGQMTTPPGQNPNPAPIPSTPSSPTPPSTPQ